MRSNLFCAALVLVLGASASAFAQQPDQPQQPPVNQDKVKEHPATAGQTTTPAPPPVPPTQISPQASGSDSLAAAARKAREQKPPTKTVRTFDNDTIPKQGGVSSVGPSGDASTDAANAGTAAGAGAPAAGGAPSGNDEKSWRELFARLRHKLEQDQDNVAVSQRELGVLDVQYYNDPVKSMQQGLTRSDINSKTAKIEAAKQQVEADKQAISEAEDQLRRAGGDIGWSR